MGKGKRNKNKVEENVEVLTAPKKQKKSKKVKKGMPKWLVSAISIAVAVLLVFGAVAAIMLSNGSFRRMQVLIKSKSGDYDINRQMATFIAWELEYYSAYIEYYTTDDTSLQESYSSAEDFAFSYATARVTKEITSSEDGSIISTPRDAIDSSLNYMINFVAVCDYADALGITVTEDEWRSDNLGITWYAGMADVIPVSFADLESMMIQDEDLGLAYISMDYMLKDLFDGCHIKQKDVEKSLKMICLYEKVMAMRSDEIKSATEQKHIDEYVNKNPQYFYTVEYLSHKTEDKALSEALEATKTPEEFKTVVAKDWFETQGNYKDVYNAYVTMVEAEKALEAIKNLTDTDEAQKWTDKLVELGAVEKTYKVADKDKLHKDLSKWLFASRSKYDEELVKTDDKFLVLAMKAQTKDADGDVETATVYEIAYDVADGKSYQGDDKFMDTMWKHLLAKKELSKDTPEVSYPTALEIANAYKEEWKDLTADEITSTDSKKPGKMEALNDDKTTSYYKHITGKTVYESTADIDAAIVKAVFADGKTPTANTILTAEVSDTKAYVIYVKSVTPATDENAAFAVIDYVGVQPNIYYEMLTELAEEMEKNIPTSADAYYMSSPTKDTYQEWMFKGANAENNFKSPIAANDTKVFSQTIENELGTEDAEDTVEYTAYLVVEPLHLDQTMLVDGGYYSYTGGDTKAVLEKFKGATDKIAVLESLQLNTTNVPTISEMIDRDSIDEELGNWFFDSKRAKGDYEAVKGKDGKTYIAVYLGKRESWKLTGESYYVSDQLNTWLAAEAASYTPSQWVLNLIGDPAPEVETTTV